MCVRVLFFWRGGGLCCRGTIWVSRVSSSDEILGPHLKGQGHAPVEMGLVRGALDIEAPRLRSCERRPSVPNIKLVAASGSVERGRGKGPQHVPLDHGSAHGRPLGDMLGPGHSLLTPGPVRGP